MFTVTPSNKRKSRGSPEDRPESDIVQAAGGLLVVVLAKTRHGAHIVVVLTLSALLLGRVFTRVALDILC